MRAGHCFISFVLLLSAAQAFPQNAIGSVVLDENAVNPYESAVDILPPGEVSIGASIVEEPVVIVNEVVSQVASDGVQSEVQNTLVNVNEIVVPGEVINELPESVNEVFSVPNEGAVNEVSSPVVAAVVDQVQEESAVENVALRSIVPSEASVEPVESQNPVQTSQSVSEVVADEVVVPALPKALVDVPESEVVVPVQPIADVSELEVVVPTQLKSDVVVPPQPETIVSESEDVISSQTRAIVPESEAVVPSQSDVEASEDVVPSQESVSFLPKILADVFESEVVLPAAAYPYNAEPIPSSSTPVPETSSVAPPTEAPVSNLTGIVFGDAAVVGTEPQPNPEADTPVNELPDRAVLTNFPEIEVIIPLVDVSLPAISGRSLDSEPVADSPAVSESKVPQVAPVVPADDSVVAPDSSTGGQISEVPEVSSKSLDVESDAAANVTETLSPTTDAPVPASTTSGVPVVASNVEEAVVPEASVSDIVSTVEANISAPASGVESEVATQSALPTTGAPLPEVVPEVNTNATDDTARNLDADPAAEISPVIPSESEVNSSTEAPLAVVATTDSPVPCPQVGNSSVPTNCRLYRTCSAVGADLILQEHECPEGYAFSPVLLRCSRDISPCGDSEPICVRSGSIADPNTSNAYYWCTTSLLGGFHKYHVQCDTNEVYVSSISRCLPEALQLSNKGSVDSRSDRDIVKAEWKILKKEIKHQAKEDKVRQKLEAKAKAHAEKLATKHLKKQKGDSKKHDDSDDEDDDEDED